MGGGGEIWRREKWNRREDKNAIRGKINKERITKRKEREREKREKGEKKGKKEKRKGEENF